MLDLTKIQQKLQQLKSPIVDLLNQHGCLSEHELISLLQRPPYQLLDEHLFRQSDTLFCAHFLIHHLLYQIQQDWYEQQTALLEIDSKYIQKYPYTPSSQQSLIKHQEPLRLYYLDLQHLMDMNHQQVDELLNQFWSRFLSYQQIDENLTCLGLTSGASLADIEQSYRKLAMQHHPDRGGDSQTFTQINQAYEQLKRSYA